MDGAYELTPSPAQELALVEVCELVDEYPLAAYLVGQCSKTMTAILRVILGPDSFSTAIYGYTFWQRLHEPHFCGRSTRQAIVKVIYTSCRPLDGDHCADVDSPTTHNDDSLCSSDDSTIILSSSQSTSSRSSWPDFFNVPRFSYDAELKLEQADAAFREKGTLLIPDPKLKSDILEGLIQAIVQHKVYVTDREFDQVAEALIKRHPCLQERGSATGYGGWKTSLKYKLSNYRTHLRKVGCPEVCVNALKHKPDGKRSPAFDVKKPKGVKWPTIPPFHLGSAKSPWRR
ncbi:uncharacterized protein LOC107704484 [Sinocyclocheilus anshuiensis]|uniref:uncharacterized protein LOC107704484 n=1 Tax=Sinocyclocheilus anshuiensis TaxID=1608454 RepID=UPI0007B7FBDD|nr:PREDICTED: uncharacterized protein LOC107704484 [Sinocyclocheilus anshuiensis]